jgi:MFS family permease
MEDSRERRSRVAPHLVRRTLTYRWVCLGLLFFSGLLAFFTRLAPAVAIPNLHADFGLHAAELGLLTSLYLWPFALMQPLAGGLTDALGPRRTVATFLLLAGVGQLLFALAPVLPVALLGRALTGMGMATLYVSAAKIMAQWFRPSEFGPLTGAWTSAANLGGLTAAAPLAALITLAGWRASFCGVGLAVLATALLVYCFVRDNPTACGWPSLAEINGVAQPAMAPQALPLRRSLRVVLRAPNTWWLGGYAFLLFGTMTMMQGLWAVPYLMDVYGQTQQQAANHLTLWAVGLIVGCTLWGIIADKVVRTPLGALGTPTRWTPRHYPMGGDVLGRLLRVDVDPGLRPAQGRASPASGRHRHGDPQPVFLARRCRVPARERRAAGRISQSWRPALSGSLPGRLLGEPGLCRSQCHSCRLQQGASACVVARKGKTHGRVKVRDTCEAQI